MCVSNQRPEGCAGGGCNDTGLEEVLCALYVRRERVREGVGPRRRLVQLRRWAVIADASAPHACAPSDDRDLQSDAPTAVRTGAPGSGIEARVSGQPDGMELSAGRNAATPKLRMTHGDDL